MLANCDKQDAIEVVFSFGWWYDSVLVDKVPEFNENECQSFRFYVNRKGNDIIEESLREFKNTFMPAASLLFYSRRFHRNQYMISIQMDEILSKLYGAEISISCCNEHKFYGIAYIRAVKSVGDDNSYIFEYDHYGE